MKPTTLRHLANLWPPFLFSGIRIEEIAADWSHARIRLKLRWYNRNYVGTQFGGSLFAMADPWWMILVMEALGRDYVVWDRAGSIDFIAPGRGDVVSNFHLDPTTLTELRCEAASGASVLRWFESEIRHVDDGELIARVRKQLYVRRKLSRATANSSN